MADNPDRKSSDADANEEALTQGDGPQEDVESEQPLDGERAEDPDKVAEQAQEDDDEYADLTDISGVGAAKADALREAVQNVRVARRSVR